ncbi:glycoside-pentoside-hexuronide (GPH):cation symporter [Rothia uropygialis]|uniref:glycoside-pentoside-hexuronide (GPH):cation symporter n=1 Tax=Kocuria sp. 36 TaxID=1415402 RepID=UPI00101E108E|nr:glycoside-pentoside-hexuronide (GPH):cation symporter [Kocuria sp. 36]
MRSDTRDSAVQPVITPRLTLKQYLSYGGGDAANNLAFSLAVSFLPLYLTDVALLSPGAVGLIFLIMRFVDGFTDIVMGSLIDRTNTRFGKFRPWILGGSVPLVVLVVLNFSMPGGLHGTPWAIAWAAVAYFLMGSVAYTSVNIPYGSLAAAMTDVARERARLAMFRSIGTAVMQVLLALLISPSLQVYQGNPDGLQRALFSTLFPLAAVALALYLFLFFTARENVPRVSGRIRFRSSIQTIGSNRALQMLSISSLLFLIGYFGAQGVLAYYARDVLGDASTLIVIMTLFTGMVLVVGWLLPSLSRIIGRPRLFQLTALFSMIGALLLALIPNGGVWVAYVGAGLFGIGNGSVNTLMWNMEADTVEYGEWKTGLRSEGTTYAVFSFVRKLSQAIAGALGVWIIGLFGYTAGNFAQSDSTQWGIRIAVGFVPALFILASILLMSRYPMSDADHKRISTELRARKSGRPETDQPA